MSSASILIIDDDPRCIRLLKAILEPEGYIVISADNAEQAIALALKASPDVILMDMMMPDVNGVKLTRQFKANSKLKEIPIVIVTAYPLQKIVELTAEAGASDLIAKPVRRQVLLEKVRQLCRQDSPASA